jgi:hypothetical protein
MLDEPRFQPFEIMLPFRNLIELVIFRGAIAIINLHRHPCAGDFASLRRGAAAIERLAIGVCSASLNNQL